MWRGTESWKRKWSEPAAKTKTRYLPPKCDTMKPKPAPLNPTPLKPTAQVDLLNLVPASVKGDIDARHALPRDVIVRSLSTAKNLLKDATDAPTAKAAMDAARQSEVYAQRLHMADDLIEQARGIKLDAMALLGKFLIDMPKNQGALPRGGTGHPGLPVPPPAFDVTTKLKDLGLSKNQSSHAQRVAEIKQVSPDTFAKLKAGEVSFGKAKECLKPLVVIPFNQTPEIRTEGGIWEPAPPTPESIARAQQVEIDRETARQILAAANRQAKVEFESLVTTSTSGIEILRQLCEESLTGLNLTVVGDMAFRRWPDPMLTTPDQRNRLVGDLGFLTGPELLAFAVEILVGKQTPGGVLQRLILKALGIDAAEIRKQATVKVTHATCAQCGIERHKKTKSCPACSGKTVKGNPG
jgi:hypothetical protein